MAAVATDDCQLHTPGRPPPSPLITCISQIYVYRLSFNHWQIVVQVDVNRSVAECDPPWLALGLTFVFID